MIVKVVSRIKKIAADMQREAAQLAAKIGNIIRAEIILGMRGTRNGRKYKVPGTGRTYFASKPGEYPYIVTGRLRASIKVATRIELSAGIALAIVGTSLIYAEFLQKGTRYMAARPFLTLAYRNAKPKIDALLKEKWNL